MPQGYAGVSPGTSKSMAFGCQRWGQGLGGSPGLMMSVSEQRLGKARKHGGWGWGGGVGIGESPVGNCYFWLSVDFF